MEGGAGIDIPYIGAAQRLEVAQSGDGGVADEDVGIAFQSCRVLRIVGRQERIECQCHFPQRALPIQQAGEVFMGGPFLVGETGVHKEPVVFVDVIVMQGFQEPDVFGTCRFRNTFVGCNRSGTPMLEPQRFVYVLIARGQPIVQQLIVVTPEKDTVRIAFRKADEEVQYVWRLAPSVYIITQKHQAVIRLDRCAFQYLFKGPQPAVDITDDVGSHNAKIDENNFNIFYGKTVMAATNNL